ncbi:hypothetical protein PG988_005719 [Apiospora saccharicola]
MSGVEVALGVVPLFISTIEGARVFMKRLKTLRHHNAFLDEYESILQQLLTVEDAYILVHDAKHPGWQENQIDQKIRSHLGVRFGRFETVLQDIQRHIEDLDKALNTLAGDAQHPVVKVRLFKPDSLLQSLTSEV